MDAIAIRLPHSREETGPIPIRNDRALVLNEGVDILVAEVKSGDNMAPNKVWRDASKLDSIVYLIRFIGLHDREEEIQRIAGALQKNYICEVFRSRFTTSDSAMQCDSLRRLAAGGMRKRTEALGPSTINGIRL